MIILVSKMFADNLPDTTKLGNPEMYLEGVVLRNTGVDPWTSEFSINDSDSAECPQVLLALIPFTDLHESPK